MRRELGGVRRETRDAKPVSRLLVSWSPLTSLVSRLNAQLSYTFQKRSRTDYVQPEDVERIKSEIANYRKFKELCERLVALSIEESKRKTEQRRKALVAVRSQS